MACLRFRERGLPCGGIGLDFERWLDSAGKRQQAACGKAEASRPHSKVRSAPKI